jgi:hypothetical protein
MSRPVRWLVLLAVIIALLAWKWNYLMGLLGWGLLFIAAAIITVVVQIKRHQLSSFLYQWHRWLGVIAFILAVWGILAFYRLGGDFGLSIIAAPDYVGALRILALVIIGIVLEAPRECWLLLVRFATWLVGWFRRRPTTGKPAVRRFIRPPTPLEGKPSLRTEADGTGITPEVAASRAALDNLRSW